MPLRRRNPERAEPKAGWSALGELEEYQALCQARLEHLVEVRQPLVLISQIQRSGGTLLAQLFDGHPECHVDPYELKIGQPKKHNWPVLDLAEPETWFATLAFRGIGERLVRTDRTRRPDTGRSIFPFLFLPRLQKAIFDRCVASGTIRTERDVLDCYFTSYFNAWLDNQNLYSGPKRAVVGFTARLATELDNVERFFSVYPDGLLISIVRDPRAWYLSASRHMANRYGDLETALGLWRESTEAAVGAADRFGDRVLLITYEALVHQTEATMRLVADRAGISERPELLAPTFNGRPIRANSSQKVEAGGILPERAEAFRESLPAETAERIGASVGDLYELAAGRAATSAALSGRE
jgi:NAD(P)-dependent dehydrogenase (short-subunit alcohol dehydrogenase family)